MPAHDLQLLIDAALAAGELARRFVGRAGQIVDKPAGAGPVTEADIAVNDLLQARLLRARPDYGWLSEETEDGAARLAAERVFIIDPIDGTRSFIEGSDVWAHSIAVAEAGEVTSAVVYLPMKNKLYAATTGQGATLNGARLRTGTCASLCGAEVLAGKPLDDPRHWREGPPGYRRSHRPSLAYRLCLVAEGVSTRC